LCGESNQAFLDHLGNYGNAPGREMAMLGLQSDSGELVRSELDLTRALRKFAVGGTGPVQAVHLREDDGDAVLYAKWPLSGPIRHVIASWLIRPDPRFLLGKLARMADKIESLRRKFGCA
jgi:hypothetical protein